MPPRVNIFKQGGKTGQKLDRERFSSGGPKLGRPGRLDPDAFGSGGPSAADSSPMPRRMSSPWATRSDTEAKHGEPHRRGTVAGKATLEAAAGLLLRPNSSRTTAANSAADSGSTTRWNSEVPDVCEWQRAQDLSAVCAAQHMDFEMPGVPFSLDDDNVDPLSDELLEPLPVLRRRRSSDAGSSGGRRAGSKGSEAAEGVDERAASEEARSMSRRLSKFELDADFGKLFEEVSVPKTVSSSESFSLTVMDPLPSQSFTREASGGRDAGERRSYGSLVLMDVEHREKVEKEAQDELTRKEARPIWEDERDNEESLAKDITRVRGKLRAISIYQGDFLAANMSQDEWRDDAQQPMPNSLI